MQEQDRRRVAREVRTMTKNEVILKAIEKKISWLQAADILGYTPRHMRRLKGRWEREGYDGIRDQRGRVTRRSRLPIEVIERVIHLKRQVYADSNLSHFHEVLTQQHGVQLSYTWMKQLLHQAKIVEKEPARGKYRRARERRPMRGMMLHMDASTHPWLEAEQAWDLVLVVDDATSEIVYGEFVPQEGTLSSLRALNYVLQTYGRFSELYTDRGSPFCRTAQAGSPPETEQNGQVARVLKTLGIRHIRALSPQARGRSERVFGTVQGRLPQELRVAAITDYASANRYLQDLFIPRYKARFAVQPAQPESAYTPLHGIDLQLLVSVQHERIVHNDHTVRFHTRILQLPAPADRLHLVRCPVLVHEFPEGDLGISFQGNLLARFSRQATADPPRAV